MSFFNTFSRGFGRSSKKNRQPQNDANNMDTSVGASSGIGAFGRSFLGAGNQQLASHQQQQQQQQSSQSSSPSQSPVSALRQLPLFMCQPFVRTALVKGSFQTIVMLPRYVDLNEWLVLNVFEFYTYLNQFYGVLQEFVTPETCPTMNAGPGVDYLWIDQNKRQIRLPANVYIDYVLTWISSKFEDETLFPTKQGVPFPAHFMVVLKNIYRQMFRIFAHIYHNHFDKIVHLSLEAHFNSFFAHFISFGKTFELMDRKEMEPLLMLIENFEAQGRILS